MKDPRSDSSSGALIHISKVAERLGLSEYQTRGLIESGELQATRVGTRTYVLARAVSEYLERIAS